jgi:hypothetical protein
VDRRRVRLHLLDLVREPGRGARPVDLGHLRRIAPASVPAFVAAERAGGAAGALLAGFLFPQPGLPEPLDLPEAA